MQRSEIHLYSKVFGRRNWLRAHLLIETKIPNNFYFMEVCQRSSFVNIKLFVSMRKTSICQLCLAYMNWRDEREVRITLFLAQHECMKWLKWFDNLRSESAARLIGNWSSDTWCRWTRDRKMNQKSNYGLTGDYHKDFVGLEMHSIWEKADKTPLCHNE